MKNVILTYCQGSFIKDNETVFNCSKTINNYYNNYCQTFRRIMMKDNCGKYINESFEFKYCPDIDDSYESSSATAHIDRSLYMLLIIYFIFF